jgi:Zn-finger protein
MSNYIKYVACKHADDGNAYLFYAPFYTNIKSGDEVLVDTKYGKRIATVVEACDVYTGSDAEKVLRALAGVSGKAIKRVIGKFAEFEYDEDETNE